MTGHTEMGIKVLGVNHRTAPLEVRERFAHGAHEVPGALARVMAAGAANLNVGKCDTIGVVGQVWPIH